MRGSKWHLINTAIDLHGVSQVAGLVKSDDIGTYSYHELAADSVCSSNDGQENQDDIEQGSESTGSLIEFSSPSLRNVYDSQRPSHAHEDCISAGAHAKHNHLSGDVSMDLDPHGTATREAMVKDMHRSKVYIILRVDPMVLTDERCREGIIRYLEDACC